MGTIWDPSPDIHNHVHPFDGNWIELVALAWGLGAVDSRLKSPEAGSESVDAKEKRYKNVINDGMVQRAISVEFLWKIDGELAQRAEVLGFFGIHLYSRYAYRQCAFRIRYYIIIPPSRRADEMSL